MVLLSGLVMDNCGLSQSSSHFTPALQTVTQVSGSQVPILSVAHVVTTLITPSGVHIQFDIDDSGAAIAGLDLEVVRHDPSGDVIVQQSIIEDMPAGSAQTFHVYDFDGSPGSAYSVILDPRHQFQLSSQSQLDYDLVAPGGPG